MLPAWIRVLLLDGRVEEMKLETYLAGAVAAEIGADAPLEALKAQAVASRTYVVSARRHPEHNADVCTAAHCQRWKRVDPISAPEIFRALGETWGIVAMHQGELINAFFFEHCDGHTRNAEDMLMPSFPYLRAVDCPCGFLTLKGHGVGVCKRGAIVMARRGASFEQILEHYYRGVQILRAAVERQLQPEREQVTPPSARTPGKKPRVKPEPTPVKRKATAPEKTKTPSKAAPPIQSPKPAPRPIQPSPKPVAPAPIPFTPKKPEHVSEPAPIVRTPPIEPAQPYIDHTPPIAEPAYLDISPTEMPVPAVEPIVHTEPIVLPVEIETPANVSEEIAPTITEKPVEVAHVEESAVEIPPLPIVTQDAEPAFPQVIAAEESPKMEAPVMMTPADLPILEEELPALEESVEVVAPRVHVDYLPGARMIAGCLDSIGVPIAIEDASGNQTIVFSGSAPHYGEGGFETIIPDPGRYTVTMDGETVRVEVKDETVFIHTN